MLGMKKLSWFISMTRKVHTLSGTSEVEIIEIVGRQVGIGVSEASYATKEGIGGVASVLQHSGQYSKLFNGDVCGLRWT